MFLAGASKRRSGLHFQEPRCWEAQQFGPEIVTVTIALEDKSEPKLGLLLPLRTAPVFPSKVNLHHLVPALLVGHGQPAEEPELTDSHSRPGFMADMEYGTSEDQLPVDQTSASNHLFEPN